MSAGSKIVPIRITEDLLDVVEQVIRERNDVSPNVPWTLSDFIRGAIREKLAHMERSRRSRRRTKKEAVYEFGG